ncbi:tRNA (adenosine(37)-N6)-dimethylallyltransferase MiaA [Flectobacillus longus]|uniref:tRNA (adenosine(37)-N6)-dimethylallyltransferase MiaA n=1 Tax=Flectobacillus longus TaxID=2984207 RepID=UPI0024B6427B|nr:tRNA (adenosine(37)-N6)-dimethylallyltransferase MiaA [Flectobacillus longus]MDI9878025.1 tRNA (adenosine(37)-N6)-dimethylallyltransferase MiaA [Flectobacillus longus]
MQYELITILGPTASGKTRMAVQLAAQLDAEIISADSRQVYRGMNLGTGKDLEEYRIGDREVPYHLIDIVNAGDSYHIFQFQKDFQKVFNDIRNRGKIAILCGGSGLYLEAVLRGFQYTAVPIDEELRAVLLPLSQEELLKRFGSLSSFVPKADTSTHKRTIRAIEIGEYLKTHPEFELPQQQAINSIIFGLNPPLELRREKITTRLHQRLEHGMVEEVKALLSAGVSSDKLIFYGLEYKWITEYLQGTIDYQTMFDRLNVAIHQFAKRQMTYFRKMEKEGLIINWLEVEPFTQIQEFL